MRVTITLDSGEVLDIVNGIDYGASDTTLGLVKPQDALKTAKEFASIVEDAVREETRKAAVRLRNANMTPHAKVSGT